MSVKIKVNIYGNFLWYSFSLIITYAYIIHDILSSSGLFPIVSRFYDILSKNTCWQNKTPLFSVIHLPFGVVCSDIKSETQLFFLCKL